jgi:photosystem II stability/assembly factor-like uncharacterized protein
MPSTGQTTSLFPFRVPLYRDRAQGIGGTVLTLEQRKTLNRATGAPPQLSAVPGGSAPLSDGIELPRGRFTRGGSTDMIPRACAVVLIIILSIVAGCSSSPGPADAWHSLGGPYARDVATLFADPSRAGTVYAALTTGELFRSSDNGTTWNTITSLGPGVRPYRFIASVDSPLVLFCATNTGLFVASPSRRQWRHIAIGNPGDAIGVHTFVADPWKPSTWYVGTDGWGIYKSTDSGTSWFESNGTPAVLAGSTVVDLVIDVARPNHVLAAVNGMGLVESENEGKQWTRWTEEFSPTGSQVVRVFRQKNLVIYATTSGSVQRSTDDGRSWSPTRIGRETGRILTLEQAPSLPNALLAGTSEGPLLSTDFGLTWSDAAGALPHVPCSAAFGAGKNSREYFAFGEAIGLRRTVDGGFTWEVSDEHLGGSTLRLLATNQEGNRIYAALTRSVLAYDRTGGGWAPAGVGLEGDTVRALSVSNASSLSAIASTSAGVFKTTDAGRSWNPLTSRLPVTPRVLDIQPLVESRVLASGDQGLFISSDAGVSWVHSLPVTSRFDVRSFTFMPTDASIVYAATANTASIISHDGGFSWEPSRYGITSRSITTITVDDQDPSVAYAWTPDGESYRTTNAGLEWNRYAPAWNPGDSVLLAVDRFTPSHAVAMIRSRELFFTQNGGGTWFPLPARKVPGEVTALLWNQSSATLYAAVRNKGLYMLSLRPLLAPILGE